MKLFYHNDLDGRCGAAVILRAVKGDPKLIEMDYTRDVPVDSIEKDEEIIIVDFSFEPKVMKQVLAKTSNVVWLDHHATAKAYEKEYGRKLHGLRNFENKSEAGCELAWRYYYGPDEMPTVVRYIGDYDKWAHRYKDSTPFYEGMKMRSTDYPTNEIWTKLLSLVTDAAVIDNIVEDGKLAIKYRDTYCKEMVEDFGYETELGGLSCYALNVYKFGSQTFGPRIKKYDACIAYVYDGKLFTVSMYADRSDVDVSKVCKEQGGGGHKGAAGFTCKTLPFKPVDNSEESK